MAAIEIKGFFPKGSPERAQMTLARKLRPRRAADDAAPCGARQRKVPPLPPGPRWMEVSAQAMHWLLYLLMLAMPVLGVLALAWSGKPVPFFGAS